MLYARKLCIHILFVGARILLQAKPKKTDTVSKSNDRLVFVEVKKLNN